MARENSRLGRDLPCLSAVRASALSCVLAFAVLAHNHPVQRARGAVSQGRFGAAEDLGRTDVGVLLEGLADGEAKAPEGDVIGDV